jgi:RimJ/RimL family protein N-acetyltransferase
MTRPDTLGEVQQFWASWLGCARHDLSGGGVKVVLCSETHQPQIFLFARGSICIVSIADPGGGELLGDVEAIVKNRPMREVFEGGFWKFQLGGRVEHIVGPAYIGCADETDFQPSPVAAPAAELLDAADIERLRPLADACTQAEWEHSSIRFDRRPIVGCSDGDTLVAAASYEVWGKRIAHIGVATHPQYRGKGYGKSVVSRISQHALANGLILQYRTLAANAPSMAIAHSLGFQEYAETISVRLGDVGGRRLS